MLASLLVWSLFWASSLAADTCDCTGTRNDTSVPELYICSDSRLGPQELPDMSPLDTLVTSYDRFGRFTPGNFLKKWTDENGNYIYPPQNGFLLDMNGNAINSTMVLETGTFVDRFGSEYGSFISAVATPYSQRSLPPSNLDTNPSAPDYPYNYHVYQVLKPLVVIGGPIAPWFGQPGLGLQFYTREVGNVMSLIESGYLQRENATVLVAEDDDGCF